MSELESPRKTWSRAFASFLGRKEDIERLLALNIQIVLGSYTLFVSHLSPSNKIALSSFAEDHDCKTVDAWYSSASEGCTLFRRRRFYGRKSVELDLIVQNETRSFYRLLFSIAKMAHKVSTEKMIHFDSTFLPNL